MRATTNEEGGIVDRFSRKKLLRAGSQKQ